MTTLPIRTYGDPVLTQATTEIENIDGRIAALAQTMIETMNEAPGVGLAANQVGVQKRLFVYDKGEGPHVVVNPKILETDGE
ncbi:MAG TPA: peptide deformylase, partial [Acidimicrobiales bacterium]